MNRHLTVVVLAGVVLLLMVQNTVLMFLVLRPEQYREEAARSPRDAASPSIAPLQSAVVASLAEAAPAREAALLASQNRVLSTRVDTLQRERDRLSRQVLELILGETLRRIASPGTERNRARLQALADDSAFEVSHLPGELLGTDSLWDAQTALRDRFDDWTLEDFPKSLDVLGPRFEDFDMLNNKLGSRMDALLNTPAFDPASLLSRVPRQLGGFQGGSALLSSLLDGPARSNSLSAWREDSRWDDLLRTDDEERTRQRRVVFTFLGLAALAHLEEEDQDTLPD